MDRQKLNCVSGICVLMSDDYVMDMRRVLSWALKCRYLFHPADSESNVRHPGLCLHMISR